MGVYLFSFTSATKLHFIIGADTLKKNIWLGNPAASIDPENKHLIQAALSELTRGKTIITIAHRLATIEQANQILVGLLNGRIVQRRTHRELMAQSGRYRSFMETRQLAEGWHIP